MWCLPNLRKFILSYCLICESCKLLLTLITISITKLDSEGGGESKTFAFLCKEDAQRNQNYHKGRKMQEIFTFFIVDTIVVYQGRLARYVSPISFLTLVRAQMEQ